MKDIVKTDPVITCRTRRGERAEIRSIKQCDSLGNPLNFPIRGVIFCLGRPHKEKPQSWSRNGKASLHGNHGDDIIDMPSDLLS